MDKDEIQDMIKATVKETLTHLGANASDAESIIELQKDFSFLRSARETFWRGTLAALSVAMGIGGGLVSVVHMLFHNDPKAQ